MSISIPSNSILITGTKASSTAWGRMWGRSQSRAAAAAVNRSGHTRTSGHCTPHQVQGDRHMVLHNVMTALDMGVWTPSNPTIQTLPTIIVRSKTKTGKV